MNINSSHLLLDACCVLNFAASEHLVEILNSIPVTVGISQIVYERELQTLQSVENNDSPENTQFQHAIDKGILKLCDFANAKEEEAFINFVFALKDDGESATGAIAIHRKWAMATDDKRATSFLKQESPSLEIFTTLDIVKFWSEKQSIDRLTLNHVLKAIRIKGRYMPHRTHPLKKWWGNNMNYQSE